MNELMDIDGPEFLSSVNEEIATIRATSETRTSTLASSIVEGTGPAGLERYKEFCVLDTNFLISKLHYIDSVLTLAEQNEGSVLVILPWVVIHELDGLKTSKRANHMGEIELRARRAMRFLEEKLREGCVALRGQKMNEILDPTMKKRESKGDDRILDCCMYFQNLTGKTVTLLSNDRNLCIKAMVHEVDSISSESIPKIEDLLNRIGKIHKTNKLLKRKHIAEDCMMELDEDHHDYPQAIEEDYDMMIDDDDVVPPAEPLKGVLDSKWASASYTEPRSRRQSQEKTPAYLNGDPTLVAPRGPLRPDSTVSNSNRTPLQNDASWTSF